MMDNEYLKRRLEERMAFHHEESLRKREAKAEAEVEVTAPPALIRRDHVDGAVIIEGVCKILKHWARWSDEHSVLITALWIAHTWFTDAEGKLLFPATPRWLCIAASGYGKSRMGKLVAKMSRDPVGPLSGVVTSYGVRNALHHHQVVVLDEFHKIVGRTGQRRQDLLAYALAYTPEDGSLNARADQGKTSSFAPMAIMAQPVIEDTDAFDDLLSRAYIIRPQKAARGDKIPQLNAEYYRVTAQAQAALSLWGMQELRQSLDEETGMYWPSEMPEELDNRDYEIAQALIAVADRASEELAARAREAVVAMTQAKYVKVASESGVMEDFTWLLEMLGKQGEK